MLPLLLILIFSHNTNSIKFSEFDLEFNNPLPQESFSVTYDGEIIVKGSNSKKPFEGFQFYVFRSDMSKKDFVNTRDDIDIEGANLLYIQSVSKIEDHYLVMIFGLYSKMSGFYRGIHVYRDEEDSITYLGKAIWEDLDKEPEIRNLFYTGSDMFGIAYNFSNNRLTGSYWMELGISFNDYGAVLYSLQNEFFKFNYRGRGIRVNDKNSWLATIDDEVYMLSQKETLISVASKRESYNYITRLPLPLNLDIRDISSSNLGLYAIDDMLVISHSSGNNLNSSIYLMNKDGSIIGNPLTTDNYYLIGTYNDNIIVVEKNILKGYNYNIVSIPIKYFKEKN